MKFLLNVLDANKTEEKAVWENKAAIAFSDIFHSQSYIQAFESQCKCSSFGGEACYFVFGNETNFILYPMLKRNLCELPFYKDLGADSLYDIASPYGFAGPIAHVEEKNLEKELWEAFSKELHYYCINNNVVSEFARLNPYLKNHEPLLKLGDSGVRKAGVVLYVDLATSQELIWSNMKKANRNSINRALRENIVVGKTKSHGDLEKFIEIYNQTMDRRNAKEPYYFTRTFYFSLFDSLKENINLFTAKFHEEVVSAALFVGKGKLLHYFLSGTKVEAKCPGATNLLLYEAIKWAKNEGYDVFDLGGGYKQGDSLYSFKQSFCKTTADFYVYCRVHDAKKYQALCNAKDKYHKQATRMQSEYFPYYRR